VGALPIGPVRLSCHRADQKARNAPLLFWSERRALQFVPFGLMIQTGSASAL